MSVRVGDRKEGKLQVLNDVRKLCKYPLNIISRDKYFPKSTRWLYAYPIEKSVRLIKKSVRCANSIRLTLGPFLEDDWHTRHQHQRTALDELNSLYDLIEDAYDAKYIKSDKAEYWTGMIVKCCNMVKAWMDSDKERYKNIKQLKNRVITISPRSVA